MGKDNLKHGQQCAIHDVSCRYFDMNGREVKEGDKIRFTLNEGKTNKDFFFIKYEKNN